MPDLKQSLGFRYLQESKFRPDSAGVSRPDIARCEPLKSYPEAEIVSLPRQWQKGVTADLWELLQGRRSLRKYAEKALSREGLAMLLWASQGVTAQAGAYLLRTAPSAGALYPIETYLAVERVDDLEPGLYHFNVQNFHLECLGNRAIGQDLAQACLGQTFIANGAVTFVWSAILRRTMSKYGHRALRYILLDAGHICQNMLLAAEALGFGGCPVAAFNDDEVNELLQIDGEEESILYLAGVGAKS